MGSLDSQQTAKLRAMQQAWIAYRDTTCNFYMDKIQGSMAIPMERPARRAKPHAGRCSFGFSIKSRVLMRKMVLFKPDADHIPAPH